MPPLLPAIVAGAIAAAVSGFTVGLIIAGLTLGLGLLTQALAPDFEIEQRDRSLNVRATAEPRRLVFGEVALGGQLALFETTGATKEFLHIAIAHADHPSDGIRIWTANNETIGPLDDAGNVLAGRFKGHLRVTPHLGALDQAADADLVAEVANWTAEHKAGGVTYTAGRLKWSADVWPNGFTGIRALMRGMPAYDPRDAGVAITASDLATPAVFTTGAVHGRSVGDQVWVKNHVGAIKTIGGQPIRFTGKWHQVASVPTTATLTLIDLDGSPVTFTTAGAGGTVTPMVWTDNWAVLVRAYLTHPATFDAQDDEIVDTVLAASANICDEQVALTPEPETVTVPSDTIAGADPDSDVLTLIGGQPWPIAHPVRLSSTGTLPAGLSAGTVYYVIPFEPTSLIAAQLLIGAFLVGITERLSFLELAASRADAFAGTVIDFTDAGTGTHSIVDASDRLSLAAARTWKGGDIVQMTTTGTLPAGLALATDYYVIREDAVTVQLATTLENARARVAITVTDAGTGDHTATRNSQLRYTLNGVVELGEEPHRALDRMTTAAAGAVVAEGGALKIYAGAATTATGSTNESDMSAGDLELVPALDRQDVFNAVKGTFIDPDQFWTEGDAPPLVNALYRSEDNGELIFRNLTLPYTTDPTMAQRLFKIALERGRQGATLKFPAKPSKYATAVWDVEPVTIDHLGYAAKEFRVMGWGQNEDFGIDILYREEAPAVWDWNLGDETTIDLAPNSNLPDAFTVAPPTALQVTEELYDTRDGSGVKARAVITWAAAADIFVTNGGGYDVRYRVVGSPEFIGPFRDDLTTREIDDIKPATYEFEVRSVNNLGVRGAYVSLTKEITGLSAAPGAPQDVTINAIGGLAIIRWTLAAELDVREGGQYKFRHSPLFSGATWAASTSIAGVNGEAIDGKQTSASLPLKPGTYLMRTFDSSGIQSATVATVTTKQASVLAYTDTDILAEHPTWLGTHTGTAGADGILKLAGVTLMDDFGLVDSIADWDIEGGLLQSGTYGFAGNFDFGSVVRRRLTVAITALVTNTLDPIDSRTALIDTWDDFDGADSAAADAVVWARHTDDDPSGSPVWTAYERLDSAEFEARAFQMRARLAAADPAYNIEVSALTVTAAEVV